LDNLEALDQLNSESESKDKKTQSQILVELASDVELFHTPEETAYAVVPIGDHKEVLPLRKRKFKKWLQLRFFDKFNKVSGSQAVEDALSIMEAAAIFKGEEHEVHLRVAEHNSCIYIDLVNDDYQAIEVSEKGWTIINNPPVYFVRTNSMSELPIPKKEGRIDQLKQFINYKDDEDFKMVVAWVLSAMKPNSPFPLLLIQGEQGSSKSTTTKVLRNLIDPSEKLSLRNLPKGEEELAIAASKAHVGAYDNISSLSNSLSDAFCKISLGGAIAKRKLYSDDEESVLTVMKPCILNGISGVGERPDLLDRSIILNLPSISERDRKDEGEFWKDFKEIRPYILGAFLDVVCNALKELPHINIKEKPRMADFSLWITAAENALNWHKGEFLKLYERNRQKGIIQSLETDPLAVAVVELMKDYCVYENTPRKALKDLEYFVNDKRTLNSNEWPTERSIKNSLTRIAPVLRGEGIYYTDRGVTSKGRLIKLEKTEE